MVEGGASLLKITKLIGLGGEVGEQRPKKGNGRDWGQTNFAKKNLQCLELAIYFGHSQFQALVANIVVEVNIYSWKLYAKYDNLYMTKPNSSSSSASREYLTKKLTLQYVC